MGVQNTRATHLSEKLAFYFTKGVSIIGLCSKYWFRKMSTMLNNLGQHSTAIWTGIIFFVPKKPFKEVLKNANHICWVICQYNWRKTYKCTFNKSPITWPHFSPEHETTKTEVPCPRRFGTAKIPPCSK